MMMMMMMMIMVMMIMMMIITMMIITMMMVLMIMMVMKIASLYKIYFQVFLLQTYVIPLNFHTMSDKDFQYYHYYLTFFFYICKKNNNHLYKKKQQEGIRKKKIKNKKLYVRKKICVYEKKKFVYNPSIFTEIIRLCLCLSIFTEFYNK